MKNDTNFSSRFVVVPAPSGGVTSGVIVVIGSLIGVATATAAEGEDVTIDTAFVGEHAKVSALAVAVGEKLYFDAATKLVNKTSTGNTLVGVAIKAAANPSAVVRLKLGATTV